MGTHAKSEPRNTESMIAPGGPGGHLPNPVPTSGGKVSARGNHAADRLVANQHLATGDQLIAPNGRVRLVMQADGNLVLYRSDNGRALWASNTWRKPVVQAVMQGDGNFVCYDAAGHPYWSSGTWGHPGASVVLQNDGNLVVYSTNGAPLWATNTMVTWQPQMRVQLILRRLSCANTTEAGHDEVYYLFSGVDGSGKPVSHRGPDASQAADADNGTAWDMNDSGDLQSRAFNAFLCDVPLASSQSATFSLGFFESDGQDWGSTVRAAAAVAGKIGTAVPVVTVASEVVGWLGSLIPKNQDDTLGGFAMTVANVDGCVVGQEVLPGSYVAILHPLDPGTGTFTVRFQHDDGDYTADFQIRGI